MTRKILRIIKRTLLVSAALILICLAVFSRAVSPALAFIHQDEYTDKYPLTYRLQAYDPAKKTVLIVADKDGTEIFDMMAPFYLLKSTEKANVYIVAEQLEPIAVRKGLYVLPQLSFAQVDSMNLPIDVIVVPNQSVMVGMKQKKQTVNFIKTHYSKLPKYDQADLKEGDFVLSQACTMSTFRVLGFELRLIFLNG